MTNEPMSCDMTAMIAEREARITQERDAALASAAQAGVVAIEAALKTLDGIAPTLVHTDECRGWAMATPLAYTLAQEEIAHVRARLHAAKALLMCATGAAF